MKKEEFNYGKVYDHFKKNENIEQTLNELIGFVEGKYLKFWITNLELDYVTFIEISREKENEWVLQQDEVLDKLYKYVVTLLSDPNKLIYGEPKGQHTRITILKKYKIELQKRVKALTAYSDQTKHYEYIYNRLESKYDIKIRELEDNDEEFAGLLIQFIFSDQDPVLINDKIKQIYTQLPGRISKNRFYNYVDESFNLLKGIDQDQLAGYSQLIKEVICPEMIADYGMFLPEIKRMLDELHRGHDLDLKSEECAQMMQLLDQVSEHIESAIGYYIYAVNVVNELIGLLTAISEESVSQMKISIDLFIQIMNLISHKKKGQALIDEEITELLVQTEGIIEGLSTELGQADVMIETALKSYEELLSKMKLYSRYQGMQLMQILSSGSYFADLEQKKDVSIPVNEFYLAQTKKELTQWLEVKFQEDTSLLQRARMANAFSVLNVTQKKPQEVHQFILDALNNCTNYSEKTVSKKLIREIMEQE